MWLFMHESSRGSSISLQIVIEFWLDSCSKNLSMFCKGKLHNTQHTYRLQKPPYHVAKCSSLLSDPTACEYGLPLATVMHKI